MSKNLQCFMFNSEFNSKSRFSKDDSEATNGDFISRRENNKPSFYSPTGDKEELVEEMESPLVASLLSHVERYPISDEDI